MLDDLLHALKQLKVFALGKGILSLAVFIAAGVGAATSIGPIIPAVVIGAGGLALTIASELYKQGLREEEMLDVYRNDIAKQLGIAPANVTRANLKEAAKDNPILEQALDRQRKSTIMTVSTAAFASLVSVLLIGAFGMGDTFHKLAEASFTGMFKPLAAIIGMGTVSAISSLILHDGLDAAIGYGTGLKRISANDLILTMGRKVARGQVVSREEVYGVLVASNPALSRTIEQQTGKTYDDMSPAEQSLLLQHYGLAQEMDKLALDISTGAVSPGHLAFVTDDYHPRAHSTEDHVADISPEKHRASFVERLGLTAHEEQSHVERLMAEQNAGALQRA